MAASMDTYLLMLYVTLEQEDAIRDMFKDRGWTFSKSENYDSLLGCQVKKEKSPEKILPQSLHLSSSDTTRNECSLAVADDAFTDGLAATDTILQATRSLLDQWYGPMDQQQTSADDGEDVDNNLQIEVEDPDDAAKSESEANGVEIRNTEKSDTNEKSAGEAMVKSESSTEDYEPLSVLAGRKKVRRKRKQSNPLRKKKIPKKSLLDSSEIKSDKSADVKGELDAGKGVDNSVTVKKENEPKPELPGKRLRIKKRRQFGLHGKYHCEECDYRFVQKKAFDNHKKDGKCKFECPYCDKVYTSFNYSYFQIHLKFHRKQKDYKCDICGKLYYRQQQLNDHRRIHTGERPYICEVCGQGFCAASALINHRRFQHLEKHEKFQCDMCGGFFSDKYYLATHKEITHSDVKKFTCPVCGMCFKRRKYLENVHIPLHTQEIPLFKCELCPKQFQRKNYLKKHMRRHNNERKYFCDVCNKGFYDGTTLKEHQRTHSGEKPLKCSLCDYRCNNKGNLNKHAKTHGGRARFLSDTVSQVPRPLVADSLSLFQSSSSHVSG